MGKNLTENIIYNINKSHTYGSSKLIEFYIDLYSGCYICLNNPDKDGYPRIGKNNIKLRLSRLIWELANYKIPKGYIIRHNCDNTKCINLNHLKLGTSTQNTHDAIKRKNLNQGMRNGNNQLSINEILKIRKDNRFQYLIAKDYGVTQANISLIKSKKNWSWL